MDLEIGNGKINVGEICSCTQKVTYFISFVITNINLVTNPQLLNSIINYVHVSEMVHVEIVVQNFIKLQPLYHTPLLSFLLHTSEQQIGPSTTNILNSVGLL